MSRYKQRKTPLLISFFFLLLGVLFCIKVIARNEATPPSTLRETQSIGEISSAFSSSKIGTLHLPETIVISEINGTLQAISFATGDEIKGGQPLFTLSDDLGGYMMTVESAKSLLDSTQELFTKTQADFSEQLKKAESTIADLQHHLKQIEQDMQSILNQPATIVIREPTIENEELRIKNEEAANSEQISDNEQAADNLLQSSGQIIGNLPEQILGNPLNTLKQTLLQSLTTTEQQLEQAKLDYELLKSTQSAQLTRLQNTLQSARQEYETAYTAYNKLTIRAPLAGTSKELFVQQGETVFVGEPLLSLIPHNQPPTLEVPLTFDEYITALHTNEVFIDTATGTIISRTPVANEEGNYTLIIESPTLSNTGDTLFAVQFPLSTEFYYLPKDIVEITNQQQGFLYLLSENEVQKFPVTFGNQRNERIEIQQHLNPTTPIITNWKSVF